MPLSSHSASISSSVPSSSSVTPSQVSSSTLSIPTLLPSEPSSTHTSSRPISIPTLLHPSSPVPTSSPVNVSLPVSVSHPMVTRSKNGIVKPKYPISLNAVVSSSALPDTEPTHFSQAMKQKAMAEEFQALVQQDAWTLVPPPSNANVIGCQWIYKIKRHSDGSVARYKARLVANGNQQFEGLDIKQPTV